KDVVAESLQQKVTLKGIMQGFKETIKRPVEVIRSSLIGVVIGIIPGAGGSVAAPVAYQQSITFSSIKEKEKFGKGSINGLIAADASNNGMVGGSLVPLLTLGIPGCSTGAVLLVALSYHGLVMGPELFALNGELVYAVLWSQFTAAFFIAITGVFLAYLAVRVVNVKMSILIPVVSVLTFIGAFAPNELVFDMGVMVAMGILGYFMKKYNYVPLAFLLGLVLGTQFEANLFRGLRMGLGTPIRFFVSPVAITLWILLLLTVLYPIIQKPLTALIGKSFGRQKK
ncbi:MAG: tripartite tricarboxylate transporter permease, partial [Desulfobacterales bacterium]|nr:tripartite tricarboxylate transporter permease [Desulfobacterales bacterium]